MARTPSTMLELGTVAPDFRLMDTDGRWITRDAAAKKNGLLVLFICNHCPFVIHVRSELAKLGTDYLKKDIGIVAINSNDTVSYPDDSFEKMKVEKKSAGYPFPYLLDETQSVAQAYKAACTPDIYLFDKDKRLVYRGQLDDSRPGNGVPVTGKDLRAAMDQVVAGKLPIKEQKPSLGCNIKWKQGNEPYYFKH